MWSEGRARRLCSRRVGGVNSCSFLILCVASSSRAITTILLFVATLGRRRSGEAETLRGKFGVRSLVHLLPPIRARHASLLRRRRARRALAIAPWAPRGAVGHARRPRRLFFADSGTWPNSPATPRECNFGSSRPTRRRCVILVWYGGGAGFLSSPAGARLTGRALERLVLGVGPPTRRARTKLAQHGAQARCLPAVYPGSLPCGCVDWFE